MRPRHPGFYYVTFAALACFAIWGLSGCTEAPPADPGDAATVDRAAIPAEAWRWHRTIRRELRRSFGDEAKVALFGGKIHAESRWRQDAVSPVGARGLPQFMPSTAEWAGESFAADLGNPDAFDPHWAIPAAIRYDAWHYRRLEGPPCHKEAKMESAYNGGLGWVYRDEKICAGQAGCNPDLWFGHVENWSARSAAAFKENRRYVVLILSEYESLYLSAGYGGESTCEPDQY